MTAPLETEAGRGAGGRPLRPVVIALIAAAFLAVDQLSKWWIVTHLVRGQFLRVGPFLKLRYTYNTGVAFGLWSSGGKILPVMAAVCIIVLLVWGSRYARHSALVGWALACVAGGALGNMIDRIRLGHVTDFIDFTFWPVFNFADTCVVIGAGLLLIHGLFHPQPKPPAAAEPVADKEGA